MQHISFIHTILYVENQQKSTSFYTKIFRKKPDLNVPGMTEFQLIKNFKLGLMPNTGMAKILQEHTPHPESGSGIPRCELYLYVDDLESEFENALANGEKLISAIENRDWGDRVCYFSDPDEHIIAFAEKVKNT